MSFYLFSAIVVSVFSFVYMRLRTDQKMYLTLLESIAIGLIYPLAFVSLVLLVGFNVVTKSFRVICPKGCFQ